MFKPQKSNLSREDWYTACMTTKDKYVLTVNPVSRNLTYYETISADEILSISKAILDENGAAVGVMIVDINLASIEHILDKVTIGKKGFVVIMDDSENFIYAPVNSVSPRIRSAWFNNDEGTFEKIILDDKYQFIYTSSKEFGWKTIGVFSLASTLIQVSETRVTLIMILCVAGIFALIMGVAFSTSIVNPILKLERLMTTAQDGNLNARFHARYNDEIGSLGRTFNAMLDRIQTLIDQVLYEQKKKRYAEINALQAQIKPHFLYNTFDTIHWLAKKYKADDIVYIVQCLTRLFRIGLSNGREIITLKDEALHAECYLNIQRIRYEDILDFEINISDELKTLYVHKLILQPLVENALYHGIKATLKKGKITIDAKVEDESILITVCDNGAGISNEKVSQINTMFELGNNQGLGYGMFNVDQRIKISYGSEYGLKVSSKEGEGTAVVIRYPIVTDLKQENSSIISVIGHESHKNRR